MDEGKVFAIENECTHQGGPLNEGELKGYGLKCPWHYAVFDVRNGKGFRQHRVGKQSSVLSRKN